MDESTTPLSAEARALEARAEELSNRVVGLVDAVSDVFLGSREKVLLPLIHSTLAGTHVLLEGLPGLGKTLLARALAAALGIQYSRIQCTPDLMPSDVTGTEILEGGEGGAGLSFRFRKGPIFANLVLADEINRATPKTQSALLEAMEEQQVTLAGKTQILPSPFSLIGTQNPVEMEGTFPLPEAQLDRFALKLDVGYPELEVLDGILGSRHQMKAQLPEPYMSGEEILELRSLSERVILGPHLQRYLAALLIETQPFSDSARHGGRSRIRLGASPRAGISILRIARIRALLSGRFHLSREDLDDLLLPALAHRVVLGFEARSKGVEVEALIPEWKERAQKV